MELKDMNQEPEDLGSDPSGDASLEQGQTPATPPGTGDGEDEQFLDETGKPLPFNNDPRFRNALKAQRVVKGWMEENEVETVEDLQELVRSGKAVVGRGLDEQGLDEILRKATRMDQVEEFWQSQREAQQRENESSDEREDRLMRENSELRQRLSGKNAADESKIALDKFQRETHGFVETVGKDLDREAQKDLEFLMGVDHPFGEIDITNPGQVQRMGKQVQKVVDRIEQRAIKGYIEGKKGIVRIGSSSTPPIQQPQTPQNFKEARRATLEKVRSLVNR